MTSYEKGFADLAEAYAAKALPEDEGKWEFVGPPDCDHSIEEILSYFAGSSSAMSARLCELLDLPESSSYGAGVKRIAQDGFHQPCATEPTRATVQPPELIDDEEEFLRELAEMDGGPNEASPLPSDWLPCEATEPPGEPRYPEFVPDQTDMEYLARSYLEAAVSLHCFTFFTDCCEGVQACRLMERFEAVALHLGDLKRREIIDDLDRHRKASDGDQWEVFKYTGNTGFWSTPADIAAILRVAESVPDHNPPERPDMYGEEFLETLRAVRATHGGGQRRTDWDREGF